MEGREHPDATCRVAARRVGTAARGRAAAGLSVLAAAAMLLVAGPAAGQAALVPHVPRHAGPLDAGVAPDECAIGISAGATAVAEGEGLALVGSLVCPTGEDAQEIPVTLYQHRAGTPGFDAVADTLTASDGSYSFVAPAMSANSAFYVRYAAARHFARARSERVAVKVVPLVSLTSSLPEGGQMLAGSNGRRPRAAANPVTLSGTVGPGAAGTSVVLQREQADEVWRRIATGVAAPDGTYSFTRAFRRAGEVSLRVVARRRGERAAASEALSFVVAARQNPSLTIQASPTRSSFGQAVTISGVLAGARAAPVTLLARVPGSGLKEVAHATTDAGGAYAFTRTPQTSTTYLVASARVRSTPLFEAVTYALSATASPAAGEAITFSGSVAPAPAGQAVYLQCQDASGLGWHTVSAATVAADGSYSISHVAGGAHSAVFRVRVPRGQGLAAASSQPLTLPLS